LKKTVYIFMGPPGSGKGTLAQRCVQDFGWATLSTGALCRKHISEQTEIGKQIDFIIKSGKLISDELVSAMVDHWLGEQSLQAPAIVLDGYPRTEAQVHLLHKLLQTKYPSLDLRIIKLGISDDEVIKRLSSRLVCTNKNCQAIYSVLAGSGLLAPKKAMICDLCGAALEIRADDKPEVIKNRLAVYHQHDLTSAFEKSGCHVDVIDADRPFEVIFEDFKRLVK
jgi:adenylate kinase